MNNYAKLINAIEGINAVSSELCELQNKWNVLLKEKANVPFMQKLGGTKHYVDMANIIDSAKKGLLAIILEAPNDG